MGLFLSAAEVWESFAGVSYQFLIGRKGQTKCIDLCFRTVDFDHLSGIHYASDVDFKLHRRQFRGDRLIPALKSGKLDDSLIEKSRNWQSISNRLHIILRMKEILESDFIIYEFSVKKLPFYSQITAEYLLYSEEIGDGVFLFFDCESGIYYCKSLFKREESDYRLNQSPWIVLVKTRCYDGQEITIFQHPNYKEIHGQIL